MPGQFIGMRLCPCTDGGVRRHEQGFETPRFSICGLDHLLRFYAGHGHGERSHSQLISPCRISVNTAHKRRARWTAELISDEVSRGGDTSVPHATKEV